MIFSPFSFFWRVIELSATSMPMRQYRQRLFEQGYRQGAFELALKIKDDLGLEKAIEISGFSREELESEQLNIDFSPSLLSLEDD